MECHFWYGRQLKANSKTDFIRKNLPPKEYTAFGGKFFL